MRCRIRPYTGGDTGGLTATPRVNGTSGLTLIQRFTVVSLVATIVLGALFGEIVARVASEYAIRRQAHASAVYVSEFAAPRLVPKDFFLPANAVRAQFEFTLRSLIGKANIVHVAVWNRFGEILYSDDASIVGSTRPTIGPLIDALNGKVRWQFVPPDPASGSTSRRMEVFVPVVVEGDARPVAVYHVVTDLADLEPTLLRLAWGMRASVVLGVLLLYFGLFTIVREASRELLNQQRVVRSAFMGIIRSLANAMDARDTPTAQHASRVAEYAESIARELGVDEGDINEVQVAALLHDVGKIGIRDELLTKHGSLSPEEWTTMRRHTVFGYEILQPVPMSESIKLAVRHSHERWDGQGYPDGIAGDQIPLAARIIAVADAYEALTTDRPYRMAQGPIKAIEEIRRSSGTRFDPEVVAAFLRAFRRDGIKPMRSIRSTPREVIRRVSARIAAEFSAQNPDRPKF